MDTKSLAHQAHAHETSDLEHVGTIVPRVLRGSTRRLTTDARFAAILAEDFGIPTAQILSALEGEPRRQAIEICAWAEKTQEPEKALANWARKHRKGSHRPRRSCAACGGRFVGRELNPVPDDHMTFFGGDELCRPCGRRHGIA